MEKGNKGTLLFSTAFAPFHYQSEMKVSRKKKGLYRVPEEIHNSESNNSLDQWHKASFRICNVKCKSTVVEASALWAWYDGTCLFHNLPPSCYVIDLTHRKSYSNLLGILFFEQVLDILLTSRHFLQGCDQLPRQVGGRPHEGSCQSPQGGARGAAGCPGLP